jgi:hypothetical protein
MRFKLEIIICIFFLLSITSFSQENKSFNFRTNSVWLLEDYYNRLIQERSPQKLYGMTNGQIMAIEFNDKENNLQFCNFWDASRYNYSIVTNNKIKVINNNKINILDQSKELVESTITYEEINGAPKIILENKDERKIFVHLNERYQTVNDIDKFINDCLITGNYVSTEDSTLKVNFASDGTLSGLGTFNKYLISITTEAIPKSLDIISLSELKESKSRGKRITNVHYFYWKKKDNRIILYRTSEPTPDAKIQGKFIELVRVGS